MPPIHGLFSIRELPTDVLQETFHEFMKRADSDVDYSKHKWNVGYWFLVFGIVVLIIVATILGGMALLKLFVLCCDFYRARMREKAERLAQEEPNLHGLGYLKKDNGFTGYDNFKTGVPLISAARNGYVDPDVLFANTLITAPEPVRFR